MRPFMFKKNVSMAFLLTAASRSSPLPESQCLLTDACSGKFMLSLFVNIFLPMWHDERHSFLWVWVSANQRIPLSALVRNLHKGLAREISYETGRCWGKARSQGSPQKKGVSDSQGKATAR